MFVFLLSLTPLPIMLFLNWRVTVRYVRVRQLSKNAPIEKPVRLVLGWWLNNVAGAIALIPSIIEWRVFVQDHRWLYLYGFTAALAICGLLLMNSGLGKELRLLARRSRTKSQAKPVDTKVSDTL